MLSNSNESAGDKRVKIVGALVTILALGAVVAVVASQNAAPANEVGRLQKVAAPPSLGVELDEQDLRAELKKELAANHEPLEWEDKLVAEYKTAALAKEDSVHHVMGFYKWTPTYGGGGGSAFDLYAGNQPITRICVRAGSLVDRLEVTWRNGHRKSAGGHGGSLKCYHCACFGGVGVRSGSLVDALRFYCNNYATRDLGVSGGRGGAPHRVQSFDQCLYRIRGRSGSLIDNIGFSYMGIGYTVNPPPAEMKEMEELEGKEEEEME